jgi:hypothetical protein
MTTTAALDGVIGRVATFGLDHCPNRPSVTWSAVNIDQLWSRAVSQRLTGLLVAEVSAERNAGLVPEEVVEQLEPKLVERALLLTSLEWRLVELIERLESINIAVAAVKGPALGRSLYPEHWWRDFGDLDVLVAAADLDTAARALESAGSRVIVAPPSRRAAALLGKGLTLRHDDGFEIDLHHTLISGGLGFGLGWDWWMADSTEVELGGRPVATTGTVRTALHLLAHLCIGGSITSLHVARDVAQTLNSIDPTDHAGTQLVGSVIEAGLDGLIQTGVERAETALGWHHEGWTAWSAEHPTPPHWYEVQRRFDREQGSFGAVIAASLRAHSRPTERLAVLRAVTWPDTDHLADRGLTRPDYTAQVARALLGRGRGN